MALSILSCIVDDHSITISFSEAVDQNNAADSTGALNLQNYTVFDPGSALSVPTQLSSLPAPPAIAIGATPSVVVITFDAGTFNSGDWVVTVVTNIATAAAAGAAALAPDPSSIARQVPGADPTARTAKDVEDAIAYPVLTEEIGYRPSPVGIPTGGGGGNSGGGGTSNLGQLALKAVSDVLGWKANNTDPRGFIGALTQAFTLTDIEGHVESTWTPRTYAVQTDLGGGITGAQASLYLRAKDALDQSLSLLDGLYPLDPEADPEYVKALREMARSQMNEIVREFGVVGLPSTLRIDTYFGILLGQNPSQLANTSTAVQFDPDQIEGTLGTLRDTYGIYFANNPFNNSVEDEQDITNFRVISDYMTSLMQSWIANREFFRLAPNNPAFFGTQLVLISRQFSVISETVNEVRFALDSVFIGPAERQTLLLEFDDGTDPMFLEDVLEEVETFANDEGPRLLRDGGKISVTNNILPVVESLQNLVEQAHDPTNIDDLPDGFKTARVRNSLDDLQDQLEALLNLTEQVEQQVPQAEDRLFVTSITGLPNGDVGTVSIIGNGFDPGAIVSINSAFAVIAPPQETTFYSSQRIDVPITVAATWKDLQAGKHEVTIANPDGDSLTVTLPKGIPINQYQQAPLVMKRDPSARKATIAAGKKAVAAKGGLAVSTSTKPTRTSRKSIRGSAATISSLQSQVAQLKQNHNDLQKSQQTILQKLDAVLKKIR